MKSYRTNKYSWNYDIDKAPWLTFLFITVIFFILQNQIYFPHGESLNISTETYVSEVIEGYLLRRIAFVTLGLFGLYSYFRNNSFPLKIKGFFGLISLFFLVWMFSSILWTDNVALTTRRLFVVFLLGFGALGVSSRLSLKNVVSMILFCSTLFLLVGFMFEFLLGKFHPFSSGYRFSGISHPNLQAINFSLFLMAAIHKLRTEGNNKYIYYIAAFISIIFLLLCKSRACIGSLIIALSFYFGVLLYKPSRYIFISYTFIIISIILSIVLLESFYPFIKSSVQYGRIDSDPGTLTGRIPLWEACLPYIAVHPFIGYGYEGFWYPNHIIEISKSIKWGIYHAHSLYIEVLLSLGFVGLFTAILIIISGTIKTIVLQTKTVNSGYAFIGMLLIFATLHGFFEPTFFTPSFPTFILIILLVQLAYCNTLSNKGI